MKMAKEIKFAFITALLGFIFIYIPLMTFIKWADKTMQDFRDKPIVIYFKEIK